MHAERTVKLTRPQREMLERASILGWTLVTGSAAMSCARVLESRGLVTVPESGVSAYITDAGREAIR